MRSLLLLIFILLAVACGKKVKDSQAPAPEGLKPEQSITDRADAQSKMLNAINSGDLNMVEISIKQAGSVDFLFEDGETPLTKTIRQSNNRIIFAIINASQNLDLIDKNGNTALHTAIKLRKLSVINYLLELNVNVNIKDKQGRNPLQNAILNSTEEICIKLVRSGADYTASNQSMSLEQMARFSNFIELANLIKKASKHQKITTDNIKTAIREGDLIFLKYLTKKYPSYIELIDRSNLLLDVLAYDQTKRRRDMLSFLIDENEHDRLPNLNNDYEMLPLHYTIYNRLDEEFTTLLLNGARLDLTTKDTGLNAIQLAASELNHFVVKKIIDLEEERIESLSIMRQDSAQRELRILKRETCEFVPTATGGLFGNRKVCRNNECTLIRRTLNCRN